MNIMQLTLNEQERAAYSAGDTKLADALAARIDAENELAQAPAALEELQDEIAHLKRMNERLREALAALLQDDGAADDITAVRKQARDRKSVV
jgi:ubiquinone biosynthesis protein UbiJ